jgi:hypothetical protein
MSDDENFLRRWSRKKSEAQREQPQPATDGKAIAAEPPSDDAPANANAPSPPSPAAQPVEFDISKLPSIDSITAASDVRAFLAPDVPAELTRAALRRAWSTDPAIRDFVGLQENSWDFNAPDGVPGFGELAPGTDMKKLIAQVFGEPKAPAMSTASARAAATQPIPAVSDDSAPEARDDDDQQPIVEDGAIAHRTEIVASQNDGREPESVPARKHGGALPK